jgi:tetratricopeptide (TPR) repeat protein
MVRICILRFGLAFAAVLLIGKAAEAQAAEATSVQQSITSEQVALRHRHYSQASRTLQVALKRFPGNAQLRLELGVYVYQRQDSRAMEVFRAILRDDPSNREAKLELARVLSYDGKYEAANQLFRELLATNPNDEAAAIRAAFAFRSWSGRGLAPCSVGSA